MEDEKVQREGEMVSDFVKSDAWNWVKEQLTNRIMDLQSIMNVDGKDAEDILLDLKARRLAVDLLMSWLRQVEGRAEQHNANKNAMPIYREEIYVTYKDKDDV